ncbi:MAG: hypothetical protein V1731_00235 [Candidatus Aenigmatarchaeota archaeon]
MGLYKCNQCGKIFAADAEDVIIVNIETARKVFLCDDCANRLASNQKMEQYAEEALGSDEIKQMARAEAED